MQRVGTLALLGAWLCLAGAFTSIAYAQDAASQVPPPAEAPAAPAPPAQDAAAPTPPAQAASPSAAGAAGSPAQPPAAGEPPRAAVDHAPPSESPAPPPPAAVEQAPPTYPPLDVPPAPEATEGEWDPWEAPAATGRVHDGFFLRLSFGFGFGIVHGSQALSSGDPIHFSGGASGGSIAIGATVVDSLAVHADLFFGNLLNPAVEDGYADFDYGDPAVGAIALGVTYYLPSNVYFGLSAGPASVTWERSDSTRSASDTGLGMSAMIGREWWIDADWGIGIAGQIIRAVADDPFYGAAKAQGYHLLLSATYN